MQRKSWTLSTLRKGVCNGPQVSRSGVLPRWHGLTEELSQDPRVPSAIGIKNLVDKNEIREKLHAWLDEHKGEEPRR